MKFRYKRDGSEENSPSGSEDVRNREVSKEHNARSEASAYVQDHSTMRSSADMKGFFRNRKVKRHHQEIDFEEIFLDKLLKERDKASEVADRKIERPLKKKNFFILIFLGIVVMGTLLIFTFKLQVSQHEKYDLLARENKFLMSYISSERGVIYDRNRIQLVWNEADFNLWAKRTEIPVQQKERERILQEIAAIIGEDFEVLKEKIENEPEDEFLVKESLGHEDLILLEARKEEFSGFFVKKKILRHYESGGNLSHILGYLGKISSQELKELKDYELGDYVGKEGLEKAYEGVLREKKGQVQIERMADGREVSREVTKYPQTGDSLVLSLDFSLQKKIAEAMSNVLKEVGSQKGAALAMNPRTGEVLAQVSLPSFDNNLFAQGISSEELEELNQDPQNPQLNRAIAGLYPVGSTIKPVVALAALEEGLVSESDQLYCPLELCIPHKYSGEGECFPDWRFHGWTDVKKAIAESVNPFFYIIGGGYQAPERSNEFFDERLPRNFEGLGLRRLSHYFGMFGLGKETSIDLPGELAGQVPDADKVETWYLGDTYNLSIGQGYLLVTPLQMASVISAIANDGKIFKPKLLKEILFSDGSQKQEIAPEFVRENLISQASLRIVKQGMQQAVSLPSGSAYSLNSLPVKVAAKTGTAQVYPNKEIYHNWIAVFAPYEEPEVVLIVLIEEVEGTRIAAQKAAKEILGWYFGDREEESEATEN